MRIDYCVNHPNRRASYLTVFPAYRVMPGNRYACEFRCKECHDELLEIQGYGPKKKQDVSSSIIKVTKTAAAKTDTVASLLDDVLGEEDEEEVEVA